MIKRVITGGQTGADQAGWRTAKAAGIPCSGWMPKGFLAEDGPHPEFAELYGAKEHHSAQFPPRTRQNVNEACVVLWFGDPESRGGKLTLGWTRTRNTWSHVIETRDSEWTPFAIARYVLNAFEQQRKVSVGSADRIGAVMVAGNRESSALGIGAWVEQYLAEVFRLTQGERP